MAITSEQMLTSEHRTTFWALADVLIPATDAMPAASEAGSAEKWLDRALAARPDLVAPLAAVLDAAAGREPEARGAAAARRGSGRLLRALAQIVSGGYYMNLKVRKRIGYPGQGKRPPFSDEAEYDLRDGLLDPVFERGPINTTAAAAARAGRAGCATLVLDLGPKRRRRPTSSSSEPAPAARWRPATWRRRASRSSASSRAAGRTPPTSPATSSSGSSSPTRSGARTRTRGSTRPTTRSRSPGSPITPVMYNAVGGSTIHFCAQWVRLRQQDYKLRTLARNRRRLAHLLRGDEAVLRADRPGDADLRHGRRPELPARAAAAPAAAPDRADRAEGGRGDERAQLALVARGARDPLRGRRQPRRLRAHGHLHVGLPGGREELHRHDHVAASPSQHGAKLITGARVREITTNGNGLATGAIYIDRDGNEQRQEATSSSSRETASVRHACSSSREVRTGWRTPPASSASGSCSTPT